MKKLLAPMFVCLFLATSFNSAFAQTKVPDLSKINDREVWSLHNREIIDDEVVHLNGQPGDGLLWINDLNFKSPERNGHSVQYISHPKNTWYYLRENFPEKYENPVKPVPEPTKWFHAKIVVDYPQVTVYVNDSSEPSLVIEQLSDRKEGPLGFWVGNNSEGWFRNLKITMK